MSVQNGPALRVENICKELGGKQILNGVSFSVNKGELLVLVGPSGGAKALCCSALIF